MAHEMDEWKMVWDWANAVWAPESKSDYSFNTFFRNLASRRAQAEGWEELGSSDVWHACFYAVKLAKEKGAVRTRTDLMKYVSDVMG